MKLKLLNIFSEKPKQILYKWVGSYLIFSVYDRSNTIKMQQELDTNIIYHN